MTPFDDYFPLLHSLGWLAALMFAAVWPSLPGEIGKRHAGWLIGFCAAQLLIAAQSLVLVVDPEWRQLASVLSGIALWEFARRVWNDTSRHRISAFTHLLAVECIALVAAVATSSGAARPRWFLPVDLLYATLPGLLGGGAVWLLWRSLGAETDAPRRAALRLAAVGLGLYGLPGETWSALSPWIVAIGLGTACLTLPATRTPAALACAIGLAFVVAVGPFAVSASLRQPEIAERADLLARVERAAAPLQGNFAAHLAADRIDRGTRDSLRQYLEKLRTADPLVHTASLWQLRAGRLRTADVATGDFVDARASLPAEQAGTARSDVFVISADLVAGRSFAIACAPLSPGAFETPTAWLALEFPEIFWAAQRQHARQTGIMLVGVLAAFCAMGFVLVSRQAMENDQRLQLERIESASRAKTEFLAFLGHELRTPLQTILGRTELIRREPQAVTRHADAIEVQGRLLLRLVTDLLDLGTIEAGKFQLQPAPFALRALLASLDEIHRPVAAAKGLALDLIVAPDAPDALVADEARLRQILGNLLGNAVKYTSRGSVTLHVSRDISDSSLVTRPSSLVNERLAFAVTDNGPGLPPEKIPQLFTLFTRLDSGDTFTREGTGVGLALVRRLCTLMGGTVSAANRPEGGAEFTVRLAFPLVETAAPVARLVRGGTAPAQPPASLAILLAEDHTATRELLTEALAALGHEVTAVADGTAALATAAARTFDVAVLDINLPGVDGVAVARQLRAQHPTLRIIGCSAEAFSAVREAALAAGFDEFLVKPVPLDALARAMGATADASATPSLFARLHSPQAATRTRELLSREWPRLRIETEAAVAAGDGAALPRLSHYLQSSALLLDDSALLELCARLGRIAAPDAANNRRALFAALDSHLASWPPSP